MQKSSFGKLFLCYNGYQIYKNGNGDDCDGKNDGRRTAGTAGTADPLYYRSGQGEKHFPADLSADGQRKENDAEHSWHLALCAVLLKEHMEEDVDLLKVMTMVLIHDLVEIDAGDTYAYDAEGALTKRDREVKAADRIFGILPEDQGAYFRELWDEFEAYGRRMRSSHIFSTISSRCS